MLVATQVSVAKRHLPPVLKSTYGQQKIPPHIIISLPVHTAV
jgi:hypothetical protein